MDNKIKNKIRIPKYILIYYIYELLYVFFWTAIHIKGITFEPFMLLYILTTAIAGLWIGYMCIRAFVRHDKNVNLPFVFVNLTALYVVSNF